MNRGLRLALHSAAAIAVVLVLLAITAFFVARSNWLREEFRKRIVAEAERATGGTVEIGAFKLDWRTLTAELDGVIIHGSEHSGSAPLLAVKRVVVGFKIISLLKKEFDIASVTADTPQAHLIIHADGSTNIPSPNTPTPGKPVAETIVALKIGTFDLTNGTVMTEREGAGKQSTPWNARGDNLAAHVTYNMTGPRYDGTISIAPLHFAMKGLGPVDAAVTANASMEKNRLTVSTAALALGDSRIDLSNLVLTDFTNPVTTAQYRAQISLTDADRIFKLANLHHTGTVNMTGDIRYASADDYSVSGAAQGSGIGYGKVRGATIRADLLATPDNIRVRSMSISALGGRMTGDAEIRKLDNIQLKGRLAHFDANSLVTLAGEEALPYDGILSGQFAVSGRLAAPGLRGLIASTTLKISPARSGVPVNGELEAKYDGKGGTLELGQSWVELPSTRVDVSGVLGRQLDIKAQSQDLNDLAPVLKNVALPVKLMNGSAAFNGTVTGPLANPRITGHASVQNAIYEDQRIDSLTGDFTAVSTGAVINSATLSWGGFQARVSGSVGLAEWKTSNNSPVNANVQLTNADLPRLLSLAQQKDIQATGTLNTTAQISGTIGDPHVDANFTLSKGQIYGEPFDSITGRAQYLNSGPQVLTTAVVAGRKRVNLTAQFAADKLTFNVTSNAMAIDQIATAHKLEPGLTGTAQIRVDGVLQIRGKQVMIEALNGDLNATALALGSRSLGNAHVTAQTMNGTLTAHLDSNAAQAAIHGQGTLGLGGKYPVNATVTFSNVTFGAVMPLIRAQNGTNEPNFDGSMAGQITVSGQAETPDALRATLDISQFEAHPLSVSGSARNIPNLSVKNEGPLRATLANSVIRVTSARFQAPSSQFEVAGAINLRDQSPLNLRVQGNVNLALAEVFDQDLSSSGNLAVNSTVRGSFADPDVEGRAEVVKGEFHYADFSNGLTNANGVILFGGTRATIQSFTAESGGGKVEALGFAAITEGLLTFRLEAKTRDVRIRYPPGVSSVSDADLTLAGTSDRSQASGTVTLRRITINPKSDISSILASAAAPPRTPEARPGPLGNMNLDIELQTAPDVAFQTSLAQSLDADANLRIRGTVLNPAVLGRINLTQGELVFFGNKYTLNQGSISFFNPASIEPILNIDLETKARGVDVTLKITGPANKPNLSVQSDPPFQFGDIVALLATGRTPNDPTLALQNTGQSQSLKNIGASALIGQAIANPVAGNLQRFFGVSRIKIDPQLVGITGSPEARLTIEQQITPDLLFTYISDVSSTSTQLFQVRWDFNPKWSALLTREENGYVGVDFTYKKRFK